MLDVEDKWMISKNSENEQNWVDTQTCFIAQLLFGIGKERYNQLKISKRRHSEWIFRSAYNSCRWPVKIRTVSKSNDFDCPDFDVAFIWSLLRVNCCNKRLTYLYSPLQTESSTQDALRIDFVHGVASGLLHNNPFKLLCAVTVLCSWSFHLCSVRKMDHPGEYSIQSE